MNASRGAVLAETALFVSAALVFLLGTIQIGAIGFLQLTSDAASYYDARANVLTVKTGSPELATHQVFDQIPVPAISPTILPAPSPTIPIDYGYNSTDPTVQSNSVYARHGGAAMLQPAQELVTVNVPGLAHILGQALGVTATAVEPVWQECGTHFNVSNGPCSLAMPPSDSQTNYFSQGENTPPYMVGRDLMKQCNETEPFGVYSGSSVPQNAVSYAALNDNRTSPMSNWYTPCTDANNSNAGYISLGTAEVLDSSNWGDTGTGGSGSNGAGIGGACDTSYGKAQNVFEAVAWHQRTYAQLAAYFAANKELYQLEYYSALWDFSKLTGTAQTSSPNSMWHYFNFQTGGILSTYNLPIPSQGLGSSSNGNIAIPEPIQTFESWEGFDDGTHGPGSTDTYNNLVHTIYSWDYTVQAGDPPNDPTYNHTLNPEAGCS